MEGAHKLNNNTCLRKSLDSKGTQENINKRQKVKGHSGNIQSQQIINFWNHQLSPNNCILGLGLGPMASKTPETRSVAGTKIIIFSDVHPVVKQVFIY